VQSRPDRRSPQLGVRAALSAHHQRIRDAIRAGEFSDRPFWNQVTTAFGRYYLDALKAWRRGDRRHAPKAWRIAFRTAKHERVSTLGDVFLGINAHVNRDLAFVYFRLGAKNRDDHRFVDTVLTRTFPIAYPEIIARLDPTLAGQAPNDPALSLDVFAWRELAWVKAHQGGVPGDRCCEPGKKRALRAGRLDTAGASGALTVRSAAGRYEARARIGGSSFL
jgi:hypothetical protein